MIDWFTVAAQIINFLILIYLLKRFLYGPILRAMDERERRMKEAMVRAEQAREEARRQATALEKERQALLDARQRLQAEAAAEVDAWREKAMASATEEMKALRRSWENRLRHDQEEFVRVLKKRIAEQVMLIGDKVLKDLADQELDRQVIRVFLEKVRTSGIEFRKNGPGKPVLVRSGLPLTESQVMVLRDQFHQWFPEAREIRFESAPELGLGIQVVAGNQQVGWNLAAYLEDLEKEIMMDLLRDTPR